MLNRLRTEILSCLSDARVVLWVRQREVGKGLDDELFSSVQKWLSEDWWFATVAFPGRFQSWQEWDSLPDKPAVE